MKIIYSAVFFLILTCTGIFVMASETEYENLSLQELNEVKQKNIEAGLISIVNNNRVNAELHFDKKGSYKNFCKSAYIKKAKKDVRKYKGVLNCKDSKETYRINVLLETTTKRSYCADYRGVANETVEKISKKSLECPMAN